MKEVMYKICLLGDVAVGKTSLIRRFVTDLYDDKYLSTIGTKVTKKVVVCDGIKANLVIWDTMGQRDFKKVLTTAIVKSKGALIVCDCTRGETYKSLTEWASVVRNLSGEVPILFLANKWDLDDKSIDDVMMNKMGEIYKSKFYFTSAKTGENVEDAFNTLTQMIIDARKVASPATSMTLQEEGENIYDDIISRFCEIMGNNPMSMAVVRQHIADAKVDLANPTKEDANKVAKNLAEVIKRYKGKKDSRQFMKKVKSLL